MVEQALLLRLCALNIKGKVRDRDLNLDYLYLMNLSEPLHNYLRVTVKKKCLCSWRLNLVCMHYIDICNLA